MALHIATGIIELMSHIDEADGSHLRVIRLADRGEGSLNSNFIHISNI